MDLLLDGNAVPRSEPRDATHIAIAAVNGIELLATWNFKHILNPATQHLVDAVCRKAGKHLANPSKFGHIAKINGALGLPVPLITTPLNYLSETDPDGT